MKIPSIITAGDSISWLDDPTSDNLGNAVDSGSWTLKYDFRQASVTLSVTATASGSGWKTSLSATQSATFAAGVAYFQAYATKASERVTLGSGQVTFLKNLAASTTPYEGRSQAQQDLDAVQAAMRSMYSGGAVQEYSIGGRSVRKIALTELITMESQLKVQVARERKAEMIKNGLGNPHNVFVRFNK